MTQKFKKIYCLANKYVKNTEKFENYIFVGKNRNFYFETKVHPKCELIENIIITREYDEFRFIDRDYDDKNWLFLQYESKFVINYIPTQNYPNFKLFPELKLWFDKKEKVEIKNIKIDNSKFAYNNPIYDWTVENITKWFDINSRDPILINKDWYLLDWQHRLKACSILWIDFIDALVQINDY